MMKDCYVKVTEREIPVDEIVSRLSSPEIGGIATFVGIVRGIEEGERIFHLEYEAYPEMAEAELERICADVKERWKTIAGVVIVHRIGRVPVGETAVVIGIAAAHREELFDALRYAIDRVKESVPIWKKEFGEKGERWISED